MQPLEICQTADGSAEPVSSDRDLAPSPSDAEFLNFTIGVTDLQELAQAHHLRYLLSRDGREEFVIRDDGTVLIRAWRVLPNMRVEKRKEPSVWLRSIRYHTYHGRPQDVDEVYLCTVEEAPNHIEQKFAVLDTPPPTVRRRS